MPDFQLKNQIEEFSYALGIAISSNLKQSGVTEIDILRFLDGLKDVYSGGKMPISIEEANYIIQEFMLSASDEVAKLNKAEGEKYLLNNLSMEGIVQTDSGLQYKVLNTGTGTKPTIDDHVKCHYHGILLDGTVFDSSIERNQPAVFPVNAVIKGWSEALQLMPVGSKWRLFVGADLAYGTKGVGGIIGPNATLIFDVELLGIV